MNLQLTSFQLKKQNKQVKRKQKKEKPKPGTRTLEQLGGSVG